MFDGVPSFKGVCNKSLFNQGDIKKREIFFFGSRNSGEGDKVRLVLPHDKKILALSCLREPKNGGDASFLNRGF